MIQLATYQSSSGALLDDDTARASALSIATNEHGTESITAHVPMGLAEAFRRLDRAGLPHVRVSGSDGGAIGTGRLEDVTLTGDGVDLVALGYSRALQDLPYTALWSATKTDDWRPVLESDLASRSPDMYGLSTQGELFIGLQKNAVYANGGDIGGLSFAIPHGSSRQIAGFVFELDVLLPGGWDIQINAWTDDFSSGYTARSWVSPANGTYCDYLTGFTNTDRLEFAIINNTGANYTFTGESGSNYARLRNIRAVTEVSPSPYPVATAGALAGSSVTVACDTTAGMYIGQRLYYGPNTANGESVLVTSITDATHFVADLTKNHLNGEAITFFLITADMIAGDVATTVAATNASQLSSDTALIASPGLDLLDETYEDATMADVLDHLASLGDTAAGLWSWGVDDTQRLYLRARGAAGRTWYVDISDLELTRTIDTLHNSAYAVYQDADSRSLRSSATTDAASIARYGVMRRLALGVRSTSSVQAGLQRDVALADSKTPVPRLAIPIAALHDATGNRWPLWYARASDTIVIRNLPPTLSASIDRIRSFRLSRTVYDALTDALEVEPESPQPRLAAYLARLTAGIGVPLPPRPARIDPSPATQRIG